ncbi:DUF4230 domain-containing protein [Fulvivirga lutea]|uniref:DUF4230 domain-containing protein n=1 Tax=Fulvivirga lutea TaxID=2810512 RepID=A0A975A1M6_9BACT|nr:DUF4230 domain-containing protein [Fulvivirga lutea]QSE98589.1 DUF4230 domain-containing protein [Fulvivirga lutea]
MRSVVKILQILPWIGLLAIVIYLWQTQEIKEKPIEITNSSILREVESLGKLELVRYNFKEITELKKVSPEFWKIFKLGPDSKIALISEGSAVGCIDLSKLSEENIYHSTDTIYINLPKPELCYYKLDMSKTRIYSMQTNPLEDEKEFIRRAYQAAEDEIKQSAINSGIMENTLRNAEIMLKPIIEKLTNKQVVFTLKPDVTQLNINK